MARTSLPPGFRFHPTDVELVMYYLKRKVLGKKLIEAIAEVNIYKFSPEDLPDKSSLKSKDLEWFFFCPREKKYASGVRVKRATENGFWKTTGKDRPIRYHNQIVGYVKTLVFHLGRPPKGERTNWVIHEYRIVDDQLATTGVQDTYVLCKVFKKDGLGPRNGAQYGAPFDEADWADDDGDVQDLVISTSNNALDTVSAQPEMQCSFITGIADPGSTSVLFMNEAGPSSTAGHPTNEALTNELGDEICIADPGSTSVLFMNEAGPSSTAGHPTIEAHTNGWGDEIDDLLDLFVDDDSLPLNDNGNHEDDFDGNDIYNGLDVVEHLAFMNEGICDSRMQIDGYPPNGMLREDNQSYIELNDLMPPLTLSPGATEHFIVDDIFGPYSYENMSEGIFTGMAHYESPVSQLPVLSRQSNREGGGSDMLQMVNPQDMERERFDDDI